MLVLGFLGLLGGCAATRGPDMITVSPKQYSEAFTTTVELVRARGWEPEFMDRRSGVIETGPVQSGSLIEPWHLNTRDLSTVVENTLSKTRTRVRVEFRPSKSVVLAHSKSGELDRPDYLGVGAIDLTSSDQPLDVRVWVYLEHGHSPNVMRSTWMPRLKATPRRTGHDPTWEQPPAGTVWVPTSRDRDAEQRLLGALEQALEPAHPAPSPQVAPTS